MQSGAVKRKNTKRRSKSKGSAVPFILVIAALIGGTCLLFGNGAGVAGGMIKSFLCGALGIASYLVPPVMILLGFFYDDSRIKGTVAVKTTMTMLFVVMAASFCSIIGIEDIGDAPLNFGNYISNGIELSGGGAVGGLVGKAMAYLFGRVFGTVLSALIAICLLSFVIGSDFFGIWKFVIKGIASKIRRKRQTLDPKETKPKGRTPEVKSAVVNTTVIELPEDKGNRIPSGRAFSVNDPINTTSSKGAIDPFSYGDSITSDVTKEENAPGNIFVEIRDDNGEYDPKYDELSSYKPEMPAEEAAEKIEEVNRSQNYMGPGGGYSPFNASALFVKRGNQNQPEQDPKPVTQNSNGAYSPFSNPIRSIESDPIISGNQKKAKKAAELKAAEEERARQEEAYAEQLRKESEAKQNEYTPVPQSDNSFSPFSDPVRRVRQMSESARQNTLYQNTQPVQNVNTPEENDSYDDILKISEDYVKAEDAGAFIRSADPVPEEPEEEPEEQFPAGIIGRKAPVIEKKRDPARIASGADREMKNRKDGNGLGVVSVTSGITVSEVKPEKNEEEDGIESLRKVYGNVSDMDGEMPDEEEITDEYEEDEIENEPVTEEELRAFRGDKSKKRYPDYIFPSLDLLNPPVDGEKMSDEEIMNIKNNLLGKLKSFGLDATLSGYCIGPTITRYEITPGDGVKVSSIIARSEDIALALAADGVRIAPVSGKSVVGVEVPNKKVSTVSLRTLIEKKEFLESKSKINVCVGVTVSGKPIYMDIDDMPHVLIAGQTKSGKSVAINCMILSLLYRATPDEVQLILIDPKMVEFSIYADIPHLVMPIIDEPSRAAAALQWAVDEMERRYLIMKKLGVRNREEYCELKEEIPELEILPQIVIVIDELADLMIRAKEQVEDLINRLAAKARACGIHLLVGTQRPSVDVVTGLIKANIPARIAFKVASNTDSKIILDSVGAEKLLGRGDMLFLPTGCGKVRVQGAFVGGSEIRRIMGSIIDNNGGADYDPEVIHQLEATYDKLTKAANKKNGSGDDEEGIVDVSDVDYEYLCKAIEMVLDKDTITSNAIQRGLRVGFNRAADIVDRMENLGFISKKDGSKPRDVLVDRAMYDEFRANHGN